MTEPTPQNHTALIASLRAENATLRDRVQRLEIRLEMGNQDEEGAKSLRFDESADGIACRDETIRLQDQNIDRLRAKLEALTGAQGLALVFDNPEPDPLNRLMQWADTWDGEHPEKNHPVAESFRTYAAAWRTERAARQATEKDYEETIAALEKKVASLAPHETCACSYDRPEDMCLHHAPEIIRLREVVATLQAQVGDLERDTKGCAP